MMQEHKILRERFVNDGTGKPPPHEGEAFIKFVTSRALAGALEPEEELCKEVSCSRAVDAPSHGPYMHPSLTMPPPLFSGSRQMWRRWSDAVSRPSGRPPTSG